MVFITDKDVELMNSRIKPSCIQNVSKNLECSSLDTLSLQIPSYKTIITLGDRAFACAAPKLWNNLPLEIRKSPSLNVFKSKLKAHLFI